MKIILKRTIPNSPAYDGTLTINGQYVCDTVENALTALPPGEYRIVRHYCKQYDRKMPLVIAAMSHEQRANQCRVESVESRENQLTNSLTSQLTNGQWPKTNSQKPIEPACNRCKRKQHVGINTTMPLLCPMLKPGNGVHGRTDGSIILGTRIVPGCLRHSLQAFGPLAERIRKAIGRGKEVTLVIKD